MTASLTMLGCQIDIPPMTTVAERDAHLDRLSRRLRDELAAGPVDLVVLPELSSLDYSGETFERLDVLAEGLDGPSFEVMRGVARQHETTVLYGTARRDGERLFITHIAVGPDGDYLGHFDKLHRANFGFSEESKYFTHAGESILVLEVNGVRVAPIICYDIRFPELTRTLVVDHHVDVILHCGAYGRDESFDSWHSFVETRAIENHVPVLSLNRAGELFGDSIFCGPWVDAEYPPLRFPAHDESLKRIDIDTAHTRSIREQYGFLRDRLPSYQGLPVR